MWIGLKPARRLRGDLRRDRFSRTTNMNTLRNNETLSYPIEMLTGGDSGRRRMDDVALEAPLEVRFAGRPATVLMRTPGHDEELVRGFLFSEGIISRADDVLSLCRPDESVRDRSSAT